MSRVETRKLPTIEERIEEALKSRNSSNIYLVISSIDNCRDPQERQGYLQHLKDSYARIFADNPAAEIGERSNNILSIAANFSPDIIGLFLEYFDLSDSSKINEKLARNLLPILSKIKDKEVLLKMLSNSNFNKNVSNIIKELLSTPAELEDGIFGISQENKNASTLLMQLCFSGAAISYFSPKELRIISENFLPFALEFLDIDTLEAMVAKAKTSDNKFHGSGFFDCLSRRICSSQSDEERLRLVALYKEGLQKSKQKHKPKSDDAIDKKIKLLNAKSMMELLYSKSEIDGVFNPDLVNQIVANSVSDLDFEDKDIFQKILKQVLQKEAEIDFEEKKFLLIIPGKIVGHISYFVVCCKEDEGKKNPYHIYYVDGANFFKKNAKKEAFGVTKFSIKLGTEFEVFVKKLDSLHSREALGDFFKNRSSNPFIEEESQEPIVETTIQKRNNCAMKSLMLLCETIGIVAHERGQEEETLEDWHRVRKEFKYALISHFANQIKELKEEGFKGAKEVWKEVKEKAKEKLASKDAAALDLEIDDEDEFDRAESDDDDEIESGGLKKLWEKFKSRFARRSPSIEDDMDSIDYPAFQLETHATKNPSYSLAASLLEKSDSSIPRESTKARGAEKVAAANTLAQRK